MVKGTPLNLNEGKENWLPGNGKKKKKKKNRNGTASWAKKKLINEI